MYTYICVHQSYQISHGEEDCIERAKVVALRAQVDPGILNEMQVFLKRVSSDCDLMTFYQTFVKCCHHVRERKNTLKKLKVTLLTYTLLYVCIYNHVAQRTS